MIITADEAKTETRKNKLNEKSLPIEKQLNEIDKEIQTACLAGKNSCEYNTGKEWSIFCKIFDYLKEIGYKCYLIKERPEDDLVMNINW